MAQQAPLGVDLVGAHPPQRRRVRVDRDRRLGARVLDAVDVRGLEGERAAGAEHARWAARRPASRSSRTLPATTATAPAETSWSWKPVSCSSIQQISQAATLSSRRSSE